uniref:SID1 transmembrane family member 1 n=1 Tax=Macrostomum lignano TaxID=282301 RepID=A0A1I8H4A9_9PLAT
KFRGTGASRAISHLTMLACRCLWPLLLTVASCQLLPTVRQIGGQFESVHRGAASNWVNYLYVYSFVEKANLTQAVRLQVASPSASREYPVLFVVRQQRSILSFQVPEILDGDRRYSDVSRTLCPVEDASKGAVDKNQTIYIDVSTASERPVEFTLNVTLVREFQLHIDRTYHQTITPSRPKYFKAVFPDGARRLSISAESDKPDCMIMSAQSVNCPVYDLVRNVEFAGEYQTMSTRAELTVERSSINGDSFYIVFVLKPSSEHCSFTRLNDLQPRVMADVYKIKPPIATTATTLSAAATETTAAAVTGALGAVSAGPTSKAFKFRVSVSLDNSQYYLPVFGAVAFFACFHILAAVVIYAQQRLEARSSGDQSELSEDSESCDRLNCGADDAEDDGCADYSATVGTWRPLPQSPPTHSHERWRHKYAMQAVPMTTSKKQLGSGGHGESADLDEEELSSPGEEAEARQPIMAEFNKAAAAAAQAAAAAAAADEEGRPRRLYLADLCQKRPALLRNKYRLYYWYLIIISIFYGLPVVQLVITYQQILRISGNQDICYYNFYCARPLGVISAFNNIFSNIGYVALGLLFLGLTRRRDLINKRRRALLGDREDNRGIPQHFGIFYAMGIALIMEGIMSGCYHVCPSYSNFQFDTAYMYVLAVLCMLKIYQTRHPDINASAHVGYMAMAIVIFVSVVGVVYGTSFFWIAFTIFFILSSLFVTGEVYYMGHWKVDVGLARRFYLLMSSQGIGCFRPMYKDRMAILAAANLINWTIAVYGAISRPRDFNSFLLYIFLVNLLMYTAFYVVMKVRSGERIHLQPLFFIGLSCLTWGAGLYFFMQQPSNWALSPSESRALNQRCLLFDFYDVHDVWHFLSAMSLFFSFMGLMTLDDDLVRVSRDCIPVF